MYVVSISAGKFEHVLEHEVKFPLINLVLFCNALNVAFRRRPGVFLLLVLFFKLMCWGGVLLISVHSDECKVELQWKVWIFLYCRINLQNFLLWGIRLGWVGIYIYCKSNNKCPFGLKWKMKIISPFSLFLLLFMVLLHFLVLLMDYTILF